VLRRSEQWTNTPHNNNVFAAMSYSFYLQEVSNERVVKIRDSATMTIKGNGQ